MAEPHNHLKIYFVLGEESGDSLAADLLPALRTKVEAGGMVLIPVGLSGPKLGALGVKSLFDIDEIAVMGLSAVVARLPNIVRRVKQTVRDILAHKPDVVVLIDSPDFTHAVAKRVRRQAPDLPIVNYICPSVWAWRSSRATKMRDYIDHVLAILPFEPQVLSDLGGPAATYIGHPLARHIVSLTRAPADGESRPGKLLILPGSRMSEVKRLLPVFGETLDVLVSRGVAFHPVIPAVPHLKAYIASQTANWSVRPAIVDSANNDTEFASARAALAASGTVSLQLALHRVPMAVAYILDPLAKPLAKLVRSWTVSLPNLIADWPVVPEDLNDHVRPQRLARTVERLLLETPERKAQLAGFEHIINKMKTPQAPAEQAAAIIVDLARKHP